MRRLLALLIAAVPLQAGAQVVGGCDGWINDIRNVDWDQSSRTFADGAIRLVQIDTAEPAAAAMHLMVLFPHPEDPFQDCRIVSAAEGVGFAALSLDRATAEYDPARGLTMTVPGLSYEDPQGVPLLLPVTVDQAAGTVSVP